MGKVIVKFTGLCGFVPSNNIWNQPRNAMHILLVDARGARGGARDEPHQAVLVFKRDRHVGGGNLRNPDLTFRNPRTNEEFGLVFLNNQEMRFGGAGQSLTVVEQGGGANCPASMAQRESFSWIASMETIRPGSGRVDDSCISNVNVKLDVLARIFVSEGTLKTSRLATDRARQIIDWEFRPDVGGGHRQALAEEVQWETTLTGEYMSFSATYLRGNQPNPLQLVLAADGNGDVTVWILNMPMDDILGIRLEHPDPTYRDPDYDFVSLYRLSRNVYQDNPVPFPTRRCVGSSGPTASNPQCPPSRFSPLSTIADRSFARSEEKGTDTDSLGTGGEAEMTAESDDLPVLRSLRSPAKSRLVVKVKDETEFSQAARPEDALRSALGGEWALVENDAIRFTINRLFHEVDPAALVDIEKAAWKDQSIQRSRLLNYFTLTTREDDFLPQRLEELKKKFDSLSVVESSYIEGAPNQPPQRIQLSAVRSMSEVQEHLLEAPKGVDAEYVRRFASGRGEGTEFVDIEEGWAFNHEDLPQDIESTISGVNKPPFAHGTRTLGVVCALENNLGVVGVAPAALASVISVWRSEDEYSIPGAILIAIEKLRSGELRAGSVVLLEIQSTEQYGSVPCEVDPAVFDVIERAVRLGLIVIEPAGNSATNLDEYRNLRGLQVFRTRSRDFRDSGAIIVGAAHSSVPHSRWQDSNWGSRVDCYAWGENVRSTGGAELEPRARSRVTTRQQYNTYANYGGTSSAAAIIAGAVLLIQAIQHARHKRRFSPREVREILRRSDFGTPSANPQVDQIGSMPNLKRVIDEIMASRIGG